MTENKNRLAFHVVSSSCTKRAKMWTMTQYRLAKPTDKKNTLTLYQMNGMAAATMGSRPIGRSLTFYRSARVEKINYEHFHWKIYTIHVIHICEWLYSIAFSVLRFLVNRYSHTQRSDQRSKKFRDSYLSSYSLFMVRLHVTRILLQELRYFSRVNRERKSAKKNWKFDIRCTIFIWQSGKLFAAQSRYLVAEEKWDSAEEKFSSIFTGLKWNWKFAIQTERTPGILIGSK